MPPWEGPFKLYVKVVSAELKPNTFRPPYDPAKVFAQVDFYRGFSNVVR